MLVTVFIIRGVEFILKSWQARPITLKWHARLKACEYLKSNGK